MTLTATRCCSLALASQDKTPEEEKTTPHTPGAQHAQETEIKLLIGSLIDDCIGYFSQYSLSH